MRNLILRLRDWVHVSLYLYNGLSLQTQPVSVPDERIMSFGLYNEVLLDLYTWVLR